MIDPHVVLGKNVLIAQPDLVNLYGCTIGDNTKIAAFVEIGKGVIVGRNCKIQAYAFIPGGVVIEDDCFIGPHVCFINDKLPRATSEGLVIKSNEWEVGGTLVKHGTSIGANATILCGITIGKQALVGAGAVVTKSVPPHATVIGNPAKIMIDERIE